MSNDHQFLCVSVVPSKDTVEKAVNFALHVRLNEAYTWPTYMTELYRLFTGLEAERFGNTNKTISDQLAEVTAQRDELLSALKFYEEKAKKMQRATLRLDNKVALECLKEIALDGGSVARRATQKEGDAA